MPEVTVIMTEEDEGELNNILNSGTEMNNPAEYDHLIRFIHKMMHNAFLEGRMVS